MTDPQQTLPPKVAEAESLLKKAITWARTHPVSIAAFAGVILGYALPKVLKWVL